MPHRHRDGQFPRYHPGWPHSATHLSQRRLPARQGHTFAIGCHANAWRASGAIKRKMFFFAQFTSAAQEGTSAGFHRARVSARANALRRTPALASLAAFACLLSSVKAFLRGEIGFVSESHKIKFIMPRGEWSVKGRFGKKCGSKFWRICTNVVRPLSPSPFPLVAPHDSSKNMVRWRVQRQGGRMRRGALSGSLPSGRANSSMVFQAILARPGGRIGVRGSPSRGRG